MGNKTKVLIINLSIILVGVIVVELIWGGWLNKQNQLNRLNIIKNSVFSYPLNGLYESDNDTAHYSRDKYGFRGTLSWNHPEKIDILTIGGSTTDQRYISDGYTWQDILQDEFRQQGKDIIVANAGIDGQTTFGHIKNFEIWFPQVPKLSPKYIFFYVGINDIFLDNEDTSYNKAPIIKNNSVIYNLVRKFYGMYQAHKFRVGHKNIDFSQVKYVDKRAMSEDTFLEYKHKLNVGFKNRLLKLIEMTEAIGAIPVFITQPSRSFKYTEEHVMVGEFISPEFNGLDYYRIFNELNRIIYEVAGNKYIVVELTDLQIWEDSDFYDMFHMTPSGAQKAGIEIYNQIKDEIN